MQGGQEFMAIFVIYCESVLFCLCPFVFLVFSITRELEAWALELSRLKFKTQLHHGYPPPCDSH